MPVNVLAERATNILLHPMSGHARGVTAKADQRFKFVKSLWGKNQEKIQLSAPAFVAMKGAK